MRDMLVQSICIQEFLEKKSARFPYGSREPTVSDPALAIVPVLIAFIPLVDLMRLIALSKSNLFQVYQG